MSSGASSGGGGETKVERTRSVSGSDNAVPKRVVWGEPLLCVPQEIPGQGRAPAKFTSNIVITSKYTILNFVPLFLIASGTVMKNMVFLSFCTVDAVALASALDLASS